MVLYITLNNKKIGYISFQDVKKHAIKVFSLAIFWLEASARHAQRQSQASSLDVPCYIAMYKYIPSHIAHAI